MAVALLALGGGMEVRLRVRVFGLGLGPRLGLGLGLGRGVRCRACLSSKVEACFMKSWQSTHICKTRGLRWWDTAEKREACSSQQQHHYEHTCAGRARGWHAACAWRSVP